MLFDCWGICTEEFNTVTLHYWFLRQIKACIRASLVAQWLRICLPRQGTRVRALVREDPTCHKAAKPVHPNC